MRAHRMRMVAGIARPSCRCCEQTVAHGGRPVACGHALWMRVVRRKRLRHMLGHSQQRAGDDGWTELRDGGRRCTLAARWARRCARPCVALGAALCGCRREIFHGGDRRRRPPSGDAPAIS
ncbi:formin [Dorcoceras hygrometricum]|uniref:Formin n=1 Tax=Dorcoceras hygrometricum TaxID=472368 RepID=A0A2Z6ZWQ5_9LAMI|nr:formin [Dorcoceras hygrometricum]